MTNYELLYILPSSMTSKEIADNFKDVRENIEKLGAKMLVTLVDHPFLVKAETSKEEEAEELKGLTIVKRKLAYPIKKNKIGFYCLINFSIDGQDIQKIDRYLALNKNVLRHIIVQDDPMTPDELALLHKLFARKRAEQEKEEKDREKEMIEEEKKKEEKEAARAEARKERERKEEASKKAKEETEVKKEEAPAEEAKEEKKEVKETKKAKEKKEEKESSKEIKKEKVEKKEEQEEEDQKEETKEKSKEGRGRKKKIKLEDLEDKLDEILEDTMI